MKTSKYKGILIKIRKSKMTKAVAMKIILLMVFQFFAPFMPSSYALTSGPGQQEYASFEPASTSDMVDLYSGDFNYNIPLINIPGPNGGYPINLAYHANVGMEQEASWVGLGWTLNVGAINRQLQGIPDDINGESITYEKRQKRNFDMDFDLSVLVGNGIHAERFGFDQSQDPSINDHPTRSLQLFFNNNRGLGIRGSQSFSLENVKMKSKIGKLFKEQLDPVLNLSYDSQNGIGISPSVRINNTRISSQINSRRGFQGLSFATLSNYRLSRDVSIGGSQISFSKQSNLPAVSNPIREWNFPINARFIGSTGSIASWNAGFPTNMSGSVSFQDFIDNGIYSVNAYGYLNPNISDNALNDYQKENLRYSKKTPYLAPSRNTYDVFAYTAQGAGGNMRGYHTGMLFYHDPKIENPSNTIGLTIEYATGGYNHIGVDANLGFGNYWSGGWEDGELDAEISSTGSYFKNFGEQTAVFQDETYFDDWENDEAVRFKLGKTAGYLNGEYKLEDEMLFDENNSAFSSVPLHTQTEDRRTTDIKYLMDSEAEKFGFSRDNGGVGGVQYYNGSSWVDKNYSAHNANHISEIQVTQPGGTKYIYGLPAYNANHTDILSSTATTGDHNSSLINLDDDDHESTENEIWNKTEYPDYAHSWMLTSVVAADYIDYDNVIGPSDGDRGYWVKFNYVQKDTDYRWRIPYQGANFIEGNRGDNDDNMATISSGTKELYYIKTIETKTHVAVFYTSNRHDARGAGDLYDAIGATIDGDNGYMQKLDKIELYAKNDYYSDCERTEVNVDAVPLQTVHFEYDYSLCDNVPNNDGSGSLVGNETANQGGKLTLKKVWFTSENSERGELSPYKFTYQNNEDYEIRNMDRWGNFKDNEGNYTFANPYPFKDFPYTEQPMAVQNSYVASVGQWALSEVQLPTGGVFNIEYESNDYAYVEGKRAQRMFDIVGVGNTINGSYTIQSDGWFTSPGGGTSGTYPDRLVAARYANLELETSGVDDGYRIYFELEEEIPSATSEANINSIIKNEYVNGLTKIWFRNLTNLENNDATGESVDYVEGYADLLISEINDFDYFGACKTATGNFNIGYITVAQGPLQEDRGGIAKCNPMTSLALTHLKFERPDIAHSVVPIESNASSMFADFVTTVLGMNLINDVMAMVIGFNLWAYAKGHSRHIQLNGKSIIKLYDPDQRKYGNGARVKKLYIEDNWTNSTANDDNSSYGQEYIYTLDGEEDGISSGVAYEPNIGGEESALREPVEFEESHFLASDQSMFVEKPILESYYPGASVGYSKVTVKSIAPEQAANYTVEIDNTATPISVYEFFTPKDFPVYGDATDLSSDKPLIRLVTVPGFYSDLRIKKARSQGYSIVTNDMAGKSKSVSSYKRNDDGTLGSLLTQQQFIYNTVDPYSENGNNKLSSEVQALIPDAADSDVKFRTATFGQTVDLFTERNESRNDNWTGGIELNFEIGTPFPIPIVLPTVSHNEFSFKTVVTHKIIHRSGILTKVIAKTDQSVIETENLAFDVETGQPLLTSVTDQYETPVYNLSYPAYWYYQNMGPSYVNSSLVLGSATTGSDGDVTGTDVADHIDKFTVGDKLYFTYASGGPYIANVILIDDTPSSETIYCMQEDGSELPTGTVTSIHMMQSGYKNMQPVSAGGTTFKQLDNFSLAEEQTPTQIDVNKIINASAVEFSDEWQTECIDCGEGEYGEPITGTINPFYMGIKGLWRMKHSYGFSTERNYPGNSVDDGFYSEFDQFPWRDPDTKDDKWISGGEVTKYSPFGFELENRDALGNYSAALYGFDNSLPTAVAVNSRYNEILADGFEDYTCIDCNDKSFVWQTGGTISTDFGHTGNYSLKVTGAAAALSQEIYLLDTTVCNEYDGYDGKLALPGLGEADTDYEIEDCECLGQFAPIEEKRYFLSAWIKWDPNTPARLATFSAKGKVTVEYHDGGGLISSEDVTVTGKVIEGWQKAEGEFTIPSGATKIKIKVHNLDDSNGDVYYDDLRIVPFHGNMNAYVYSHTSYKLLAELDENNYATFYIYDEAGNLVMMKKETAEGIKTITEGRSDSPKNQ